MYERILLPTDGSAGAERATEHAIELARLSGGTIIAMNVVDTSAAAAVPEAQAISINELFEEAGSKAVDAVVEQVEAQGIPIETELRTGSAHGEILAVAQERDVDVIVMGTHGRTGLDRVLLGSVADRVIRHADYPVMVTRARK